MHNLCQRLMFDFLIILVFIGQVIGNISRRKETFHILQDMQFFWLQNRRKNEKFGSFLFAAYNKKGGSRTAQWKEITGGSKEHHYALVQAQHLVNVLPKIVSYFLNSSKLIVTENMEPNGPLFVIFCGSSYTQKAQTSMIIMIIIISKVPVLQV